MVRHSDDIANSSGISNLSYIHVLHGNNLICFIAKSRLLMLNIALTTKVIKFLPDIHFSDYQRNIPMNFYIKTVVTTFRTLLYRGMRCTNNRIPKKLNLLNFLLEFSEDDIDKRRLAIISKLRASK